MSVTVNRGTYPASMILLQHAGFNVATVIDVGAAEGAFFAMRRQLGLQPGAKHFFIDCMDENAAVYLRLKQRGFDVDHAITAVADMVGEVELSLDPNFYNTHIGEVQDKAPETYSTRRVPVTTLDRIVAQHDINPPFGIKFDVQGAELAALRGSIATLKQAAFVTAEVQVFIERDSFADLVAFMTSQGFALFDITDIGYYPNGQIMFEVYATFIPRQREFRRSLKWAEGAQLDTILKSLKDRRANVIAALDSLVPDKPVT